MNIPPPQHPYNRHLFVSDNYELLKGLETESVDLITTDPPFAKNATFVGNLKPALSDKELALEKDTLSKWGIHSPKAAVKAGIEWTTGRQTSEFDDIFTFEKDVHEDWMISIAEEHPAIKEVIEAAQYAHSANVAAYICYMSVRLIECHRVLKPTGSLFLHCDWTANSYLRAALDAIFGSNNFGNEIIWQRASGRAKGSQHDEKKLGADTDTILRYTKTEALAVWNPVYAQLDKAQLSKKFPLDDKDGRGGYNLGTPLFCSPSMGARPNLCYTYEGPYGAVTNPHPSGWRVSKERLTEMDQRGDIVWSPSGGRPKRKAFLQDYHGKPVGSLWLDIPNVVGSEGTGYPTQKPWALAKRIIEASTNEGDVVFDPFAGCAYTAVAAEELGRQWIACDISPRALTVLRRQFAKKGWSIDGKVVADEAGVVRLEDVAGMDRFAEVDVSVKGPRDVPERAADDVVAIPSVKPLPERKYKRRSSDMPRSEMVELLARLSEWMCWGCGFAVRGPDGEVVETAAHFHLDHIEPKAEGGSNLLHNRAVLCSPCNTEKGKRTVRLKDFRRDWSVVARRTAYGVSETDLCDLDSAQEQAMLEWSQWRANKGLDHPTIPLG